MDVRMPDGIIIKDVPEGTTQADLMARLERMKTGQPQSFAQRAISAVSAEPGGYGIPREVVQGAAAMPIPALTTLLGATAGTIGGPPGAVAGGMIGGGAGEAINQKLGITEPSEAAVGLNIAAPLVGRYLQPAYQAAKRGLTHILPGAGLPLQERAAGIASAIPPSMGPAVSSERLYTQLEAHNPPIDAGPFRERLMAMKEEAIKELGDSPEKTRMVNYLESKISELDKYPNDQVPFDMMRSTQKRINARIGSKEGGEDLGILKQLAKGIKSSFEATIEAGGARPEAVGLLKEANKAFIQEKGQAALEQAFTKTMAGTERAGGVQTFSDLARKNVKKALNMNEDIKAAYSTDQINQMKQALDAIGPLPSLPPESPSAVYQGLRYSGPAVAGGAIAYPLGIHPLIGATAGMSIDWALRHVVMSNWGSKKVIEWATAHGTKVPPEVLMSIASALTAGVGGVINPAEAQGAEPIRPPTNPNMQGPYAPVNPELARAMAKDAAERQTYTKDKRQEIADRMKGWLTPTPNK